DHPLAWPIIRASNGRAPAHALCRIHRPARAGSRECTTPVMAFPSHSGSGRRGGVDPAADGGGRVAGLRALQLPPPQDCTSRSATALGGVGSQNVEFYI